MHTISPDIPNFTWEEIRCQRNGTVLITDRLFTHMTRLQAVRDYLGRVRITSGYRSPEHNAQVGGSPASQHLLFATDIQPLDSSLDAAYALVQQLDLFGHGGIGRYDTFLHVDLRGKAARWDYRTVLTA